MPWSNRVGAAVVALGLAAAGATLSHAGTPSPYGNLTVINAGTLRYRWERNGLGFDLRDRHGTWTDKEALQVRDALDKLPDLYIRKAIKGGVVQIYRDGKLPSAPWQFAIPPQPWIHAVTVPPAPWHYIAVGDNMFVNDETVYRVMTHECGHSVQWGIAGWFMPSVGTPGWTKLSWTTGVPDGNGLKSWNGFVTDYARTNHLEDFAETAKYYWLAPDLLKQRNPAKFAFMRDVVYEGLVPPASAADPQLGLCALIQPSISSVAAKGDELSEITVHGDHFMGTLDGGFNEVRYGGHKALHLPVSRKLMYSWVPSMNPGSAPVTVTTQDGTTNAAPFEVTKPWWKFW
jgi:hypothetical protein